MLVLFCRIKKSRNLSRHHQDLAGAALFCCQSETLTCPRCSQRTYTPAQVALIIDQLGEPEEWV